LCESGLLPGALLRNTNMQFICKNVNLTPANTETQITRNLTQNQVLQIPIAHGEGRFYADADVIEKIEKNRQVIFRYCNEKGEANIENNPNGSTNNIAGICNEGKNVFGMMPHPERCASDILGNTDGSLLFDSIFSHTLAD